MDNAAGEHSELQQPLHGCAWEFSCCHSSQIGVEETETDFIAVLPFPHSWSNIPLFSMMCTATTVTWTLTRQH